MAFFQGRIGDSRADEGLIPARAMTPGEIGRYYPDAASEGKALIMRTYTYWVCLSNPGCDWRMPPRGKVRLLKEGETVIMEAGNGISD